MCVTKIARPDIHHMVSEFSTRVKEPNDTDWKKMAIMIKYLNGTNKNDLNLNADDLKVVKYYLDASFAVHPDLESYRSYYEYGTGSDSVSF